MADFYSLKVSKIRSLTPNAVAVTFEVTDELSSSFDFEPGQYITVRKEINGKEIRRAYSISSSNKNQDLTIGVKKVDGGGFSDYANTSLSVGDTLEVMPPEGRFVFKASQDSHNVVAFAAGSGITPIMSIAQAVLDANTANKFVLMYGNQTIEETMFYEDLQGFKEKYPDRFYLYLVMSRSQPEGTLFGRIDRAKVNFLVKNKHKDLNFSGYYLCGPEPMIELVKDTLKGNGVSEEQIYFELFTTTDDGEEAQETADGETALTVLLDDEEYSFSMKQNGAVLDAVLKENIDAPYSCQGGICSTCIARITEGKATMVKNQILTDSEIEEGFILTCQAHPTTPVLKIDYDDV